MEIKEPDFEEYGINVETYPTYIEELKVLETEKDAINTSGWFSLIPIIIIFIVLYLSTSDFLSSILLTGFFGLIVYGIFKTEFFVNFFSFGKYKELENSISLLKENFNKKVKPFESAVKDYYENILSDIFETKLYRKRSGNKAFEESLSDFSDKIETAKEINRLLLMTTRINLSKYEEYLTGRQIDHYFKKSQSKNGSPLLNIVKQEEKKETIEKQIVPVAPEKIYHTARKIDWDKVNQQRGLTGSQGEKIAMAIERDYLIQIGYSELADKVKNVSKEIGDGLGYDILSYFPDGREKYIEVKSSTKANGQSFHLSSNELSFLQENLSNAVVYRIFSVNDDDATYNFFASDDKDSSLQILSVETILNSQIIPTDYLIKL